MMGKIIVDWGKVGGMLKNSMVLNSNQEKELVEEIKDCLDFEVKEDKTIVYALVVDNEKGNSQVVIPCQNGYSLSGYAKVKDTIQDCYLMEGVEHVSLGTIGFSVCISLQKTSGWSVPIPIPDRIVEKFITPYHRRIVKELKSKYSKPRFTIHYVQMLECN
jgi:hypothetical protein